MIKYIISVLTAITVFFIVYTILHILNKDKLKVAKRIENLTPNDKNEVIEKHRKNKSDRNYNTKVKFLKMLENEISLSGIMVKPFEFLMIWIIVTTIPSIISYTVSHNFIVTLAVMIIGVSLPPFILHKNKVKRVELFEKQLVDAVAIICNCLRSGLTFQQALVSISSEMPDPISKEFGRALREMKLGNNLEKALSNMAERINSKNYMLIVSAVLIQRQIGGNLSEILSNIAGTIKERYKIKSEIKVLTTTGRMSGMVVGLMPIFIILFFMLMNPEYVMSFFESSIGIGMIITAVILETLGFLIINKIVNVKF